MTTKNQGRVAPNGTGTKFDPKRTAAEVGRLLRADIQEQLKSGALPPGKYVVRAGRTRGWIDVIVEDLDIPRQFVMNPDGYGGVVHSPEFRAVTEALERMIAVYNRRYGTGGFETHYRTMVWIKGVKSRSLRGAA